MPDYIPAEEWRARAAEERDDDAPDPEHAEAVAAAIDAMIMG